MAVTAHSTNVIRLPTAPERKVRQNHNRAARAAKAELPQFPGERLFPGEREAMRRARLLSEIEPSPTMELVTAMLGVLSDADRMKVAAALAVGVVAKRPTAEQALAVLHSTRMTQFERVHLDRAMRWLGSH